MKKFLIVFILFVALYSVDVKAANKYADVRWIPNVYYNYNYNGVKYWGQMAYIFIDSKLSYCVDITKNITNDPYTVADTNNINNDILLYGYFGYGYSNNITFNDYLATQKLIWKSLGVDVYYTTLSNGNGNLINVDENINTINKYVDEYNLNLSLDNDFKFEVGSEEIININKLSNNFIVDNVSNNNFQLTNNKIIINPNIIGQYNFKLKENYLSRGENKLYVSNNSQTILQVGNVINKEYSYDYSVSGGTLEVNVTNENNEELDKNIFNLYNKYFAYIGEYETSKDGKLIIKDLYPGDYILEHLYTSEGYTREKILYNFAVSKENIDNNININLKPKTTEVFIKKAYGNPIVGTYYVDNNVSFDFYNSKNEIIDRLNTDENGELITNVSYDEYNIVQSSINKIKEYVPDYKISKSDFNGNIYYDIYTPVFDSKLKIYLYEMGTTIPISNSKITINNKEYTSDEEGIIITDYLKEGLNYIYQEKINNYIINDEITFEINETNNFYIENDEVYIDFIIYNEKKVEEPKKEIVEVEEKSIEIVKELPNLFSNFFEIIRRLYKC
jgi:hypothetical protein